MPIERFKKAMAYLLGHTITVMECVEFEI